MPILIIEDDAEISGNVVEYCLKKGYVVEIANNGTEGLALALTARHSCIVTDLMLPGVDGVSIIRRVREAGIHTPIIVLTAKGDISDKVEGLDAGADDYLAKPFSLQELEARIRALVRRGNAPVQSTGDRIYRVGPLSLSTATKEVTREGRTIPLSKKHFQLLELLMKNVGRVVSKTEIEAALWVDASDLTSDVVRTHMQMLRAKMDIPFSKGLIRNVRGMGYVIKED
jgi:two-component system OmpR family response regulator